MSSNRSGYFIKQPSGYKSFVPNPLPPNPAIMFDKDMIALLSKADRMLGRLDGVTQTLPNPDMFVAMYVKKEAVLSSQIEGTQASLSDLLAINSASEKREDIGEVVNYVNAMNYGLDRLDSFPLSLRLIREIHSILLHKGRGSERNPGEFRTSQNWIGPAGCTLTTATFVPPAVPDMLKALGDLETYFYKEDGLPALIKIALIHAQFESIHPFLDGNGRMGRLLITFWLCQQRILSRPLLYLSYYFKQNRNNYYDRLMDVRLSGNWERWVKFFLEGVSSVSNEAVSTAKEILRLKNECEEKIAKRNNINYQKILDYLFENPLVSKSDVSEFLNISSPTAGKIVDDLCSFGVLFDETPNQQRYKKYSFRAYINILNRGTEL